MKTTVELTEDLVRRAKQVAVEEGTTLRALLEAGLRAELEARESAGFSLIDASIEGDGLQAGVQEGDWQAIRDLIYEGRGG